MRGGTVRMSLREVERDYSVARRRHECRLHRARRIESDASAV